VAAPMSGQAQPERISGGTMLALLAMGISVIVLAQDFSAVNVALPVIERHFDTDISTVQWVINAYALVFGMLIVPGGRLADQFGRKRVFLIGAGIFAITSFLAGIAPSIGWLIGARALMGIGGALMWPAILGMTFAALPPSKAGLAGGLIIGAAGIGQGLGPITGGALTEISWRWVQFINVPVALFAMAVTWLEVHQPEAAAAKERLDYGGIVTLSLGLFALLFALDQATTWGWSDPRIIGLLVAFLVLGAAFVLLERRAGSSALVPGDVIGNRQFAASGVAMALVAPAFVAPLLLLPQFMQKLLGYSPLEAGLGLLPQMGVFAIVSFAGGWLYGRLGPKLMVSTGAGCMAVGVFLLSLLDARSGYGDLVAGMVVLGLGLGLFYASVTTAAVQSVDPSRTSLAGGIVYMFQLAGGAIGLGLTTTVVMLTSRDRLNEELATLGASLTRTQALVLQGLLADTDSAREMLGGLPPAVVEQVTRFVAEAFADGIRNGLRLDALLALGAVVVAVLLIGKPVVHAGWHQRSHPSPSHPSVPGDHEAPVRD
jgi:EmrB/QacA subfamily drug resistance transporter